MFLRLNISAFQALNSNKSYSQALLSNISEDKAVPNMKVVEILGASGKAELAAVTDKKSGNWNKNKTGLLHSRTSILFPR